MFLKSLLNLLQYCFCFLCFGSLAARQWDPSFQTRDGTCTACIGRRSLNQWTTREVPELTFRLFGSSTDKNIIVAVIVYEGIFVF